MAKKLLQFILKILSQWVLRKYRPTIVGVTGNVGKTSTKEAIYAVLSRQFSEDKVRRNSKNYNNEIGVPLTILGIESGGRSSRHWLKNFFAMLGLLLGRADYPKILILEMGADKPGDIRYLVNFVPVKMGVITSVGEIPVHIEFFKSSAQVAREKSFLISKLTSEDWAILNYDDEAVRRLKGKTRGRTLTYGLAAGADARAINLEINEEDGLFGLVFRIDYQGKLLPVRLRETLGQPQVYAALAAFSAGISFGMNAVDIIEALEKYRPPAGRVRLLAGVKKSIIIDDTYNASPSSTVEALKTLDEFAKVYWLKNKKEKSKKIAVLGDMLELGQFTERAHRMIGERVALVADLIFAVGLRAQFIADEAEKRGFPKNKIFRFKAAEEAKIATQKKISSGDVVLIKGSQGMRMEKITEEIMADPLRAKELLVRQEESWKKTE